LRPPPAQDGGEGSEIDGRIMVTGARDRAHADTDRDTQPRRPPSVWIVGALLAILSLGGSVGGISFIADPTGRGLGAEVAWLDATPVGDFLLPGWFILIAFAVAPLVAAAGLARGGPLRPVRRLDRALGYRWPWAMTILIGITLVAWIGYELAVMPATMFLQPILVVLGLALVLLPLRVPMRKWYRVLLPAPDRGVPYSPP
jgi:hypothetical protein